MMKHRWLVGILIVIVLLVGTGGVVIWLKAAKLKDALVANLGEAMGAHVTVASIDFNFWQGEMHAAGITLVNERPSAPWEKGAISQATVRFKLRDIFSPIIPLTVEVSGWSVTLHPYAAGSMPAATTSAPGSIRVTGLSAQQGEVDLDLANGRQVVLTGVGFDGADNGAGTWTTSVQASAIKADAFAAGTSSMQVRGDASKVTFSDLRVTCQNGIITGGGEVDLTAPHAFHAVLKAVDVPVGTLVSVPWQVKLSGLVNGDLTYEGDDQGGDAHGQITINHGKFNVLPWLGKMTALVSLPDISDVEVDKATSDFDWKNGTLQLSHIDVRKNDIARVGGDATVTSDGQIDGRLKLGLPASVLAKWPQLQQKVFTDTHDDFSWTDVHLTGTPDHLQEDLTSRVLAAGVQQGGTILNDASQKAMDLLNGFLK